MIPVVENVSVCEAAVVAIAADHGGADVFWEFANPANPH